MKKFKITQFALLLTVISNNTLAIEPEFDLDSLILTIPTIKVGNDHVYDATLKLKTSRSFDLIGFSDQPPITDKDIDAECTPEHVNLDTFNQITEGMTFEQVTTLIGCESELHIAGSSFSDFWWKGGGNLIHPLISVKFNSDGSFSQLFMP